MNLAVEIAGIRFKNPLIAASGTFGYGVEYSHAVDIAAQHHVHPHRRLGADVDIADHLGRLVHERRSIHRRSRAFVAAYHRVSCGAL